MLRTVGLGAPSLTGKDANDLVAEAFADATYPLRVVVQNHMPQDVAFPEVEGLFLRHVANSEDSRKVVVIATHDLFQRLASSVEQIAELNRCKLALVISEVSGADALAAPASAAGKKLAGTKKADKTDPVAPPDTASAETANA